MRSNWSSSRSWVQWLNRCHRSTPPEEAWVRVYADKIQDLYIAEAKGREASSRQAGDRRGGPTLADGAARASLTDCSRRAHDRSCWA